MALLKPEDDKLDADNINASRVRTREAGAPENAVNGHEEHKCQQEKKEACQQWSCWPSAQTQ